MTMKKYRFLTVLALFGALQWFSSCKPDEPVDPNEEELITKAQLTCTDSATGAVAFNAVYSDPDGDGGNGPVEFDSIFLDSGKVYNVRITLLDESDSDNIVNITDEVLEEANQHLFCYTPAGVNVVIERTDSDGTFPIGITTKWRAGGPSTGAVTVELRHQPDGAKNGTCTPGSTDLLVNFQAAVQ